MLPITKDGEFVIDDGHLAVLNKNINPYSLEAFLAFVEILNSCGVSTLRVEGDVVNAFAYETNFDPFAQLEISNRPGGILIKEQISTGKLNGILPRGYFDLSVKIFRLLKSELPDSDSLVLQLVLGIRQDDGELMIVGGNLSSGKPVRRKFLFMNSVSQVLASHLAFIADKLQNNM